MLMNINFTVFYSSENMIFLDRHSANVYHLISGTVKLKIQWIDSNYNYIPNGVISARNAGVTFSGPHA